MTATDPREWAQQTADAIVSGGYVNMGVTYDSSPQEYGGEITDVLLPMPPATTTITMPAKTMLILPGIQRSGGLYDPHGLLDRDSATEYAKRRGYVGQVLEVSGETGASSAQTVAALKEFRADPAITALYGFSGGGYNVAHVLDQLTPDEKQRLKLVVVLGAAPMNSEGRYQGSWELVWRGDPPAGHMAGPKALLAELVPAQEQASSSTATLPADVPAQVQPADVVAKLKACIGKYHDGPDVPTLAREVGTIFPEFADYCRTATNTMPWCADFQGWFWAHHYRVKPPATKGGVGFFYVNRWQDWGTPIPVAQRQPGDVCIWLGSPHHISAYVGNGKYVGGNQSDAVTEANFRTPDAVRRAPATATPAAEIIAPAATPKTPGQFEKSVAYVLKDEGGNSDDPRDPGGRTSRGITQREWDVWRQSHSGLPSDVWQAPQDQVLAIYRQKYWDALACDQLPPGVDYAVFDYGVNSGISRSAKALQTIVGVNVDGEIGPQTIAAARDKDPAIIVTALCDQRMSFLRGLSTWGTFGRGWTNRVNSVREHALAMAAAAPQVQPLSSELYPPLPQPPQAPMPQPMSTPVFDPSVIDKAIAAAMARFDAAVADLKARITKLEQKPMTDTTAAPPAAPTALPQLPHLDQQQLQLLIGALPWLLVILQQLGIKLPAIPGFPAPPPAPLPGASLSLPSSLPQMGMWGALGIGAVLIILMSSGAMGTPFGLGATPTGGITTGLTALGGIGSFLQQILNSLKPKQ